MTTSDALAARVQAIEGERASLQTLHRGPAPLALAGSGATVSPLIADGNAGSMATSS